jgi:hypothetical protein
MTAAGARLSSLGAGRAGTSADFDPGSQRQGSPWCRLLPLNGSATRPPGRPGASLHGRHHRWSTLTPGAASDCAEPQERAALGLQGRRLHARDAQNTPAQHHAIGMRRPVGESSRGVRRRGSDGLHPDPIVALRAQARQTSRPAGVTGDRPTAVRPYTAWLRSCATIPLRLRAASGTSPFTTVPECKRGNGCGPTSGTRCRTRPGALGAASGRGRTPPGVRGRGRAGTATERRGLRAKQRPGRPSAAGAAGEAPTVRAVPLIGASPHPPPAESAGSS